MRLILRGGSVIDWKRLHFETKAEVDSYLRLCLFEPDDPFDRARLSQILDEAVDYLRKSFRYKVAAEVAQPAQVQDLFLFASGVGNPKRRRMACLVLKVMHVVHHVEARGLLHRARLSEEGLMQLVTTRVDTAFESLRREGLPIATASGSVKTRHSVITKLLAKKETLAAQIYDKVRYRVVMPERAQVMPTLVRLCELLIPFNFVVPGQTQNTLISFRKLVHDHPQLRTLLPHLQIGLHLEDHDRKRKWRATSSPAIPSGCSTSSPICRSGCPSARSRPAMASSPSAWSRSKSSTATPPPPTRRARTPTSATKNASCSRFCGGFRGGWSCHAA